MEGNRSPTSDDLRELAPEGDSTPAELRFECGSVGNGEESREDANGREGIPDPRVSLLVGANEARYKSMSPARLPIARAPCLTIPPGLSPSALLEPPVLLPDVKVGVSSLASSCSSFSFISSLFFYLVGI